VAGYITGPLSHGHSEDRVLETCPYLVTLEEKETPSRMCFAGTRQTLADKLADLKAS